MDLNFITELYIPIVLVICLCVGFVIKLWLPLDNKYIPTIMLVLGAVLGCVFNQEISLTSVGAGMVTGLASTGLHQVFKQLLKVDYCGEMTVAEAEAWIAEDEELQAELIDYDYGAEDEGEEVDE